MEIDTETKAKSAAVSAITTLLSGVLNGEPYLTEAKKMAITILTDKENKNE